MDIPQTTPKDAHAAMAADPKATYLDVRTEGEFEQGHPPGALNVPVMLFEAGGGPAKPNERFLDVARRRLDPAQMVFVGCQSGTRSQRAAEILARAGYQRIANVAGGFGGVRDRTGTVITPGWKDSELPIETGQPSGHCYRDLAAEK